MDEVPPQPLKDFTQMTVLSVWRLMDSCPGWGHELDSQLAPRPLTNRETTVTLTPHDTQSRQSNCTLVTGSVWDSGVEPATRGQHRRFLPRDVWSA